MGDYDNAHPQSVNTVAAFSYTADASYAAVNREVRTRRRLLSATPDLSAAAAAAYRTRNSRA